MVNLDKVRQLVETTIKNNWTATPIAYDNVSFKATIGQSFIAPKVLFGSGSQVSLGTSNVLNRWTGVIQIDIFTPINIGTKTALDYANTLIGYFYHYDNEGLVCFTGSVGELGKDGEWYRVVVTIPFQYDQTI